MSTVPDTTLPSSPAGAAAQDQPTAVEHVLTVDCVESPGIVHAISEFLLQQACDIIDIKQFREVDAIWAEWVGPPYPVSTCVQVSQPPLSSFDIEGCLCGGDNC